MRGTDAARMEAMEVDMSLTGSAQVSLTQRLLTTKVTDSTWALILCKGQCALAMSHWLGSNGLHWKLACCNQTASDAASIWVLV